MLQRIVVNCDTYIPCKSEGLSPGSSVFNLSSYSLSQEDRRRWPEYLGHCHSCGVQGFNWLLDLACPSHDHCDHVRSDLADGRQHLSLPVIHSTTDCWAQLKALEAVKNMDTKSLLA